MSLERNEKVIEIQGGDRTISLRTSATCELKLYGSWFCPYVQRVWVSLEEKKLDYQWIEVNPYKDPPPGEEGNTKMSLSIEEKRQW